jgi:glucose-6-phosphate dehydrogenase assembly protein OpcA
MNRLHGSISHDGSAPEIAVSLLDDDRLEGDVFAWARYAHWRGAVADLVSSFPQLEETVEE